MSDDRSGGDGGEKSWIDKIALLFSTEPRNRGDLEDVLAVAAENEVIDEDARSIMEGAMQVSDMQARDIMIPRGQMVVIKTETTLEEVLPQIIRAAHSRYLRFSARITPISKSRTCSGPPWLYRRANA
jgi:magnesium and cobalt transporter